MTGAPRCILLVFSLSSLIILPVCGEYHTVPHLSAMALLAR